MTQVECAEGYSRAEVIRCPNMLPVEGDLSMDYEHYSCAVCGQRDKLDYEEMK